MNLYLPIEILNREFQSKLLIAMESASKGMSVYMGNLISYLRRDFFVPGIILNKSITPSPARIEELTYFRNKKFIITSLDEEVGLFQLDSLDYVKLRYSEETIKLTNKIFTWGKYDHKNLSQRFRKYKKKFILSGNPRLDFWTKKLDFYFTNRNFNFKNFILFSNNFGFLFSKEKFKKALNFIKKANYPQRGYDEKKVLRERKISIKLFKEFTKLIKALVKKTDLKIIVRPHPTENLNNYKFLNKFKNVAVIKEGNISEWIYNSKIVIHSGCTGGLEASIRGKPTISYIPFKAVHGHTYANKYSLKINSLRKCLKMIEKIEKNKIKIQKINLKDIRYRAHNFLSKKTSYSIIAEEFVNLIKSKRIYFKNNDIFLNLKFKLRDLRSKILKKKYGNEKFSTFNKKYTLEIFEIFKKLNPKYNNLKIYFIKKNIILIKKSI